jgi:hypothetical protein
VSRCLRTVEYSRSRQCLILDSCPVCGYEFDANEKREHHIGEHTPEDFGLSPLGETAPDHDAPLFGGVACGD